MQVRDKVVGRVVHFLHAVLPEEPQERAQSPFPQVSGLAEDALEGGIVSRHVV